MPNHLFAPDSNRHPPQGASSATSGQVMRADGADVVTWVSFGGDVSGPPNNLAVIDLTIASQAQGDVLYYNGTNWTRLPIGTASQVLRVNASATAPEWATGGGGGGISGPGSSTDRAIATWNGVGGAALRDNTITVDAPQANGIAISYPSGTVALGGNNGTLGATGLLVGYGAQGNFTDVTALGHSATVSGSHGTAVGRSASAASSGVALGRGATAAATSMAFGRAAVAATGQVVWGSTGLAYGDWYGPEGVSTTTTVKAPWQFFASNGSGVDQTGADLRHGPGAGTGAGTPGVYWVSTAVPLASGSTTQTRIDRLALGGSGTQTTLVLGNPGPGPTFATTAPVDMQLLGTSSNGANRGGHLTVQAGFNYSAGAVGTSAGDLNLFAGNTAGTGVGAASAAGNVNVSAGSTNNNGLPGVINLQTYAPGAGATTTRATVQATGEVLFHHQLDLVDQGNTTPGSPALGRARVYGRNYAERCLPEFVSELGRETTLQPNLWQKNVTMLFPGSGATAGVSYGTAWTIDTTQATPTPTSTSLLTSLNRFTYATAATLNDSAGCRSGRNTYWRGNASGLGGFFFFARVAVEAFQSGMQIQVGLFPTAAIAGEPSAVAHSIILCKDSTDTNWQLAFRDATTATKVDLGVAVAASDVLDVYFYAAPNSSEVIARVVRVNDGLVLADDTTHTANLPSATQFLCVGAQVRTTAAAIATIAVAKLYCESDL